MEDYKRLKDYRLAVDVFGYWPSFHDGEIHWMKFDRTLDFCPSIEFLIHTWEMASETDEKGYFKLRKHHLVHFRFENVYEVEIGGFNNQNAVLEIQFQGLPETESGVLPIEVVIEPAYGLGGRFKAYTGVILSVTPCDEKGLKV